MSEFNLSGDDGISKGPEIKNILGIKPLEGEKLSHLVDDSPKVISQEDAVGKQNVKLLDDESVSKVGFEALVSAKNLLVEQFQNAWIEQKQTAVTQFYNALNTVYEARYRGASVPIVFSNSGGYAFNHDGFIRVSLDELENQIPEEAVFSILHEYRHAMQSSLHLQGFGLPALTQLTHDLRPEEIDATKFAFENMVELGLDQTKIRRYGDWKKTIEVADAYDLLKEKYEKRAADAMFEIYRLLDEYTFQTTRSDLTPNGIRGIFHKMKIKFEFRSNIVTAKKQLKYLERIAAEDSDRSDPSLLRVITNIRDFWPQYKL